MSQIYKTSTGTVVVPANIPTSFVTDSGAAVPALNILNVLGSGGITTSASGNTLVVHENGLLKPSFSAYLSTSQNNVTGDGTTYQIVFDTVIYDQASNYNPGTGIFTAPITGKYLFNVGVFITDMTTQTSITVTFNTTSDPAATKNGFQAGNSGEGIYGSFIASMIAGDTCFITTSAAAGAKNSAVVGQTGPMFTYFQGALLFQ